ncbi:prepilin-type [Candidatus Magnetobacterium bavaricum]|uniref:Prepilin-type n=1 Tax=Candidatus Magnetobacterium bavaricum TaxID=29290 RepID=A0A0F3GPZ6_9BACT|nr:prepilin-type [Candidatus Magnetobacterium bavaricum]
MIEVLIAVTIFTSMVMLSMVALNQGLGQYKKLMQEGIDLRRYAASFWLHQSVSGMLNYTVMDNNKQFPYFRCSYDGVSYVSTSPLSNNIPVVVWIVREKGTSLTYYELPVYAKRYEDIERDYSSSAYKQGSSFVILQDVTDVRIESYVMDMVTKLQQWTPEYDTKDTNMLPTHLKISYKRGGKQETLFFSIHTNKTIRPYNDISRGV